jgi:hypothetical protein
MALAVFVNTDLWHHPKLIRLAGVLKQPTEIAGLRLIRLWCWTMKYHEDGDLSRCRPEEIAEAAGWKGRASDFSKALKVAGWRDADGRLHDWEDRQGSLVRARKMAAERVRRWRSQRNSDVPDDVTVTVKRNSNVPPSLPFPSLPIPSKKPSIGRGGGKDGGSGALGEGFTAFWTEYPRKVGKHAAVKAWAKIAPDAALSSRIVAAVVTQKSWPQWTKDEGQFIPHPTTWLNQRRWEDEPPSAPLAPSKEAEARAIMERRVTSEDRIREMEEYHA